MQTANDISPGDTIEVIGTAVVYEVLEVHAAKVIARPTEDSLGGRAPHDVHRLAEQPVQFAIGAIRSVRTPAPAAS